MSRSCGGLLPKGRSLEYVSRLRFPPGVEQVSLARGPLIVWLIAPLACCHGDPVALPSICKCYQGVY